MTRGRRLGTRWNASPPTWALLLALALPAVGQIGSPIPSTGFTRTWLRSTNAEDGRLRLGLAGTNVGYFVDWETTQFATNDAIVRIISDAALTNAILRGVTVAEYIGLGSGTEEVTVSGLNGTVTAQFMSVNLTNSQNVSPLANNLVMAQYLWDTIGQPGTNQLGSNVLQFTTTGWGDLGGEWGVVIATNAAGVVTVQKADGTVIQTYQTNRVIFGLPIEGDGSLLTNLNVAANLGYAPQLGSANLTNWSSLATNVIGTGGTGGTATNALPVELVTPPPGITPPFNVYRSASGIYTTDVNHEDWVGTRAVTNYVLATGNDTANGLSWATAKRTVTNAIAAAGTNSVLVFIGPGTYAGSNYAAQVDTTLIATGGVASVQWIQFFKKEAYIRGITWPNGMQFTGGDPTTLSNNFVAVDCHFTGGVSNINGVNIYMSTGFAYMLRCSSSTNFNDGFNYKAWSSYPSTAWMLEQDCVAEWNGPAASANGSSMHDGWSGVRLNGTYRYSMGRNVHDIHDTYGEEDVNGMSWNLNCRAGGSRTNTFNVAFSNPPEVTMVLQECVATDGAAMTEFPEYATVIRGRTELGSVSVTGSGLTNVSETASAVTVSTNLVAAGATNHISGDLGIGGTLYGDNLEVETLTITGEWDASGATNLPSASGNLTNGYLIGLTMLEDGETGFYAPTGGGMVITNLDDAAAVTITGDGQVFAAGFEGDGSAITNIDPAKITWASDTVWPGATNTITIAQPFRDYIYTVTNDVSFTNIADHSATLRRGASFVLTNGVGSNCVIRFPASWWKYGTALATNSVTITNGGKMLKLEVEAGNGYTNILGAFAQ